jgi:tripartite-type tricarboxylate transporter receptor subunit TctC
VTTATRLDALPDVPIVGDFVPGYSAIGWYGLVAPRNTPADIVERLNKEINAALGEASSKAQLAHLGVEPMPMTSAEFSRFITDDVEKWAKVIRDANIRPE